MPSDLTQMWIALGIAGACASTAVALAAREPGTLVESLFGPEIRTRATADGECAGAAVRFELSRDESAVSGMAEIVDPEQRAWTVRLSQSYEGRQRAARTRAGVAVVIAPLADLDEGTQRSAAVRPVGTKGWCRVTADLRSWRP